MGRHAQANRAGIACSEQIVRPDLSTLTVAAIVSWREQGSGSWSEKYTVTDTATGSQMATMTGLDASKTYEVRVRGRFPYRSGTFTSWSPTKAFGGIRGRRP